MPFLQNGRNVRGVIQGESVPKEFIPLLVDYIMAGSFPVEKMITFYPLADINRAAAESSAGKSIKPVLRMPHEQSRPWSSGLCLLRNRGKLPQHSRSPFQAVLWPRPILEEHELLTFGRLRIVAHSNSGPLLPYERDQSFRVKKHIVSK